MTQPRSSATIAAFARNSNSGLIVLRIVETITNRELIAKLAAKYRLPTVYPLRTFATSGGLVSYGPDIVAQFQEFAGYVDRILKGEKPAELPVQTPTKYDLTINLKAAKAIGLTMPATISLTRRQGDRVGCIPLHRTMVAIDRCC